MTKGIWKNSLVVVVLICRHIRYQGGHTQTHTHTCLCVCVSVCAYILIDRGQLNPYLTEHSLVYSTQSIQWHLINWQTIRASTAMVMIDTSQNILALAPKGLRMHQLNGTSSWRFRGYNSVTLFSVWCAWHEEYEMFVALQPYRESFVTLNDTVRHPYIWYHFACPTECR